MGLRWLMGDMHSFHAEKDNPPVQTEVSKHEQRSPFDTRERTGRVRL
jgi:hypothetical protein